MPTIENFATVSYTAGGVAATKVSNLAETQLEPSISFTKNSVGATYGDESVVTYILTITNTSANPITNISITDDLGTFAEGTLELTPLTYTPPALLLIGGLDQSAQLTTDSSVAGSVTFSFPSLASGQTANIIYRATVNEFAPLAADSQIVNTAELTSSSECANSSATARISAALAADVSVFKQMCPNPVICGDTVTYTIRIYNYGNIPAENIQVVDAFDPAPTNITVSNDGTLLPATSYTYINGLLTAPTNTAAYPITVPAATYNRDETTGIVSVTPGVVEFVITGTI